MYYTAANEPVSEREMERLIEGWLHDGGTVEDVTSPFPGIVFHAPGEPDRFYSKG